MNQLCKILVALFAGCQMSISTADAADDSGTGLATPLSNAEAWKRLPPTEKGGEQPLPVWARMLAGPLPRTAAAMLQVDYAHRIKSQLDPKLRAKMRWMAAHENQCKYAEEYAIADGRKAGLAEEDEAALRRGDTSQLSAPEKAALQFAVKMSRDSASVTDDEFAVLVKEFGEGKAASMVLLMAWSNFQDRFLNCLGASVEKGGPLPPVEIVFKKETNTPHTTAPSPAKRTALPKPTGEQPIDNATEWTALSYRDLQDRLENQRKRSTRVSIPKWEDIEPKIPAGMFTKPTRIVWNQVCLGHAPELGVPWEIFMRSGGAESAGKLDRIFAISLFWVTTKAVKCPYCMGHCEMNWEVAGLTKDEIAERSKLLAGSDWSSFSPEQQRAFAFARKLNRSPGAISAGDIAVLRKDYGDSALVVALSAARYHYMTRISNGFQLSLERDNVFYDYWNVQQSPKSSK